MVFGNLSTGYWLGAAAAAGLHWVELGRKTLSGTSDTIDVGNTTWLRAGTGLGVNQTGKFTINKNGASGNNGSTKDLHSVDGISSVSTTQWTLRCKIRFSALGTNTNVCVGLSDSDSSEGGNTNQDFIGARILPASALLRSRQTDDDEIRTGQDNSNSFTWAINTDYFLQIERTSSTAYSVKLSSTDSFSADLVNDSGSSLASGITGLRYIKICDAENDGAENCQGEITDLKFWNGTNTTSGTPSYTAAFSCLTAKPYMMVLQHGIPSGNISSRLRLNFDTGSNYAQRGSRNGASDSTGTSRDNVSFSLNPGNASDEFLTAMIMNKADQEKLWVSHGIDTTAGASNDPNRSELTGKWANTSDSITSVNVYHSESGDYAVGSEVVVLGYDPDDTEGTSVWEELADVEVSSGSIVNTGTIDAKKYLMIQLYTVPNGTSYSFLRFNSDTGTNYASRYSTNGGSDATGTSSDDGILFYAPLNETERYMTAFIINKSDKEKLVIGEGIAQNTAGAGNAPERRELYGKWANTSASITSIQVDSKNGSFAAGTRLKVWGFD